MSVGHPGPARLLWAVAFAVACSGGNKDQVIPPTDDAPGNDADGDGFSIADGDCNDDDEAVYPGANDVAGDGIDADCDLTDGVDADRDGHAWTGSGGDDCDDADDTVFLGAPEIGWDDVDQDCDGRDNFGFDAVAAGADHTCAVDTDGLVRCFGVDDEGQVSARPQDAGWKQICSGTKYSCAVHSDERLACWGTNDQRQQTDLPAGNFLDVACTWETICALDTNREVRCWGSDEGLVVSNAPAAAEFADIAVGRDHACAITQDNGIVACWGEAGSPGEDPVGDRPPATSVDHLSVIAGAQHSCAVRKDLGLECWGDNNLGQLSAPSDAGPFTMLATSNNTTCSVKEGATLDCWGSDTTFIVSQAPTNDDIAYVSVGREHACGLRTGSREMVCWGKNTDGRATVPWP